MWRYRDIILLRPAGTELSLKAVPTNEQLAVELKVGVAFRRSLQEAQGQLVHLQRRLLHIPLRSDVMPLFVVQRHVRLYRQNHRPITHIKREGHDRGCCGIQNKTHKSLHMQQDIVLAYIWNNTSLDCNYLVYMEPMYFGKSW